MVIFRELLQNSFLRWDLSRWFSAINMNISTAVYLREFGHHHFNISQTELKHPANKADVSYSHPMRKNTWRSFKCLRKILFPWSLVRLVVP